MFNFEHFNTTLTSKRKDRQLLDKDHALRYLYTILYRETDTEYIDFNAFSLEDIEVLLDEIEMDIDYIGDGSGEEEILITDHHWFGVIDNMEKIIDRFNNIPRVRPKSTYKFI